MFEKEKASNFLSGKQSVSVITGFAVEDEISCFPCISFVGKTL